MRGILHERDAFIRDVEKDDCCAQDGAASDDLHVEDVGDAHQQEDEHLAADALKADSAGELVVCDGAHDAGDVVHNGEDHERNEQAIAAAEEVAQPATDGRKHKLNGVPEFFHDDFLLKSRAFVSFQTG